MRHSVINTAGGDEEAVAAGSDVDADEDADEADVGEAEDDEV
jgi:hypothetical protein